MIIGEISPWDVFLQALPPNSCLCGFDVGVKRTGVALSDNLRVIASPLETMIEWSQKKQIYHIKKWTKDYSIGGYVVGWPLLMNNMKGERCEWVEKWIEKILVPCGLPIWLQDERLSTQAIHRMLREMPMNRKKRETMDDRLAASYILQNTLDRIKLSEPCSKSRYF